MTSSRAASLEPRGVTAKLAQQIAVKFYDLFADPPLARLAFKILGLELLGVALSFHWTIPPAAIKSKRENAVT